MKVAALDLGSNTFLLLLAEVTAGKVEKVYGDHTRVVKLGQGVQQNKRFHPDALKRAEDCFRDYQKLIEEFKPEKVMAVATSAARDAENKNDFFALAEKYHIPVKIIPGAMEAEITFQGATCDFENNVDKAVIDVGGGSTEIIGKGEDKKITGKSVDVGSVRLTEMFFPQQPPKSNEVKALFEYAQKQFGEAKAHFPKQIKEVIAVAGTPTSLACLELAQDYDESLVHKLKLTRHQIEQWIDKMSAMTIEEREKIKGMPSKRADVLVAGSLILLAAMINLNVDEVTVSTRGVRFGVALKIAQGEL